jgi:hypothetical protein
MYGEETLSRPHVFGWHEMLEGREKTEDKHPYHPITVKTYQTVENMRIVAQNDCLSIRNVAQ